MKNNNLKYIRKHKHWYERTINKSDRATRPTGAA